MGIWMKRTPASFNGRKRIFCENGFRPGHLDGRLRADPEPCAGRPAQKIDPARRDVLAYDADAEPGGFQFGVD
jgi:hypothetical protein